MTDKTAGEKQAEAELETATTDDAKRAANKRLAAAREAAGADPAPEQRDDTPKGRRAKSADTAD